jgi:hypothetical protein
MEQKFFPDLNSMGFEQKFKLSFQSEEDALAFLSLLDVATVEIILQAQIEAENYEAAALITKFKNRILASDP